MNYSKELSTFINVLAGKDDTFGIMQSAFDEIGRKINIAKLEYKISIITNILTGDSEEFGGIAYLQEGISTADEPACVKEIPAGCDGTICFMVYRTGNTPDFTDEETEVIDACLSVIGGHVSGGLLQKRVRELQSTDGLTGLLNVDGFLKYMQVLVEKKEIGKYNAYYFNLSRFTLVNKRFGSAETNYIIVRYTQALQEFMEDVEVLGRLGGDNFTALILKERTEMFLQFLSGIITYGMLGGKEVPVKISAIAGVVELDDSVCDVGGVMNDAAMALNSARHIVKRPFMFATQQMRDKGIKNKQIESVFTEALYNGEFKVYYQPKVSGQDYRVVGGEALSRWYRDGVMMAPMDFIPVIEQNGTVCMLDFYVLDQVCKDITQWLKEGVNVGRISVNFSRKHLSNPHLVEDIMDVLRKYDMAGRYIEIELTETVDEVEAGLLVEFIKRMKYHKVRISIDDFGTGYSSLNMLRSFSVDVLKIDKSFIDNLDERNKIVLSNIIRMAHELDMEVVAEGVETNEQATFLRQIGCHTLQGYLFDKPLPKNEYETKLMNEKYDI